MYYYLKKKIMQVHIFTVQLNRRFKIHVGLPVLIEDNDINSVDCPFKMKKI
jgi:hypothetical protein